MPSAASLSRADGARSFHVRGTVAAAGCAPDVTVSSAHPRVKNIAEWRLQTADSRTAELRLPIGVLHGATATDQSTIVNGEFVQSSICSRHSQMARLSPQQPESQLDEPLKVRLPARVPVNAPEVGGRGVLVVLQLVVHRAVQKIERLDAELEPHLIGDAGGLGEIRVDLPVDRTPEFVIAEHRRAPLEPLPDEEVRLRAAVSHRTRRQVVVP